MGSVTPARSGWRVSLIYRGWILAILWIFLQRN
jgi:hypothetical protein